MLDYFRLCNLELKASAYQFYQLLRRITLPMAPAQVVNLYNEFRRTTRIWRWLKRLKWNGFGHNWHNPMDVQPGELAIYCPACPQPGINLPENWKEDPDRFLYRRVFVADGNFKADHVRQEKVRVDHWLSEGGGMDPQFHDYDQFLLSALERPTVSRHCICYPCQTFRLFLQKAPCENSFRAIQNALLASSACDITGKVAIACARHGCYAPNSLVDLFKGEQQKNVDYAFLQALRTTHVDADQGVMIIYDIACQYMVHLTERIGQHLDPNLKIDSGIGLFHVHAHKDECLFRFATSYIPGAAVTAGEILESMWSTLNSISPTVRTATLAHRAEVLDDHCCDANHKKGLGIIYYLCKRQKEAMETLLEAREYLDGLQETAGHDNVLKWRDEIVKAEADRLSDVKVMDIYKARVKRRTAVEARDDTEDQPMTTLEHWMDFALIVEEKQ